MQAIETKLPHLVTALPGPKAKQIVKLDSEVVSPSYTRDYPLVAKTGRGATVEDVDGNTFLDFAAGIAVVATGHCHPEVVAAIQKQASELIHMSGTDFYYPNMVELAQKLASIVPGKEPKRVYFGNSGAEAVEAAIKLAKYHTKRDKLVAFHGAFHGRTIGALSLTASRAIQRKGFGTLLSGVFHMPYPDTYRGTYGVRPETASADCLSYLENELFRRRVDPDEVAGIFIEPIQGEGGYLPAPPEFLQGLQRICRKYGILLVADEVQSGMGRTGKWWACDYAGVEPDILCTAKGIASGMPLSAMIARASVMNWTPGAHGTTFRRQSGLHCCVPCDDSARREAIHGQRGADGRLHYEEDGRLAREAQDRRRYSRTRVDDRNRVRARSEDEGESAGPAQSDCRASLP